MNERNKGISPVGCFICLLTFIKGNQIFIFFLSFVELHKLIKMSGLANNLLELTVY